MPTKLFVYGVNSQCPKEILEDEFGKCGQVDDVYVTEKGFAFVTMADKDGADAAIKQLHGEELDGQPIKVEEARPREDRNGGRSFGSRGGFGRGGGGFGRERGGGGGDRNCYNCNKPGHMARDCRQGGGRDDRRGGGGGNRACYNCNKEGHMARECPEGDRRDRR